LAYRRHHSTETAVLIVYNDIGRAVDKGQVVPLVLLDLSSAFDSVDQLYGTVTVYQQQFVKLTACIRLGARSKHICLVYVLMTD